MSEREFWGELYRGLSQMAGGIGTIMAAIAKRYLAEKLRTVRPGPNTNTTPPPTFAG